MGLEVDLVKTSFCSDSAGSNALKRLRSIAVFLLWRAIFFSKKGSQSSVTVWDSRISPPEDKPMNVPSTDDWNFCTLFHTIKTGAVPSTIKI